MRLKDKVVLISGASRGMGRAYAMACAREGAKVAVNYTSSVAAANEVAAKIEAAGGTAVAIKANIAIKSEVDAMIDQIIDTFGQIDVFVGNAGILFKAPVLDHTEQMFDDVFAINVKGNFFCAQRVAREMIPRRQGKIVFCSSIVAVVGEHHLLAYTATKGAIVSMARVFALELAEHQINVNVVLPGTTKTDMSEHVLADDLLTQTIGDPIPLGRLGTPEDLVGAVLFFASSDSDWATGQTLIVDGGFTAI
jgi:3-oxoacyl-[acyl-carrier protein] reductase